MMTLADYIGEIQATEYSDSLGWDEEEEEETESLLEAEYLKIIREGE